MKYNTWLNYLLKFIMENKKLAIPMASNSKAKDLYTKLQKCYQNEQGQMIRPCIQ